jgi:hypothetical protein
LRSGHQAHPQDRDFYVRRLWHGKGSAEVEDPAPRGAVVYAESCGWTPARVHARSGDRIAIAAYLGAGDAFPKAICDFAAVYADQNERDYEKLVTAVESGWIAAGRGL